MEYMIAFAIGVFIGANAGVLVVGCCVAAKRGDAWRRE
jgi:hypothetical protein